MQFANLFLIACLGATSAAQAPSYDDAKPEFWTRRYPVPETYHVVTAYLRISPAKQPVLKEWLRRNGAVEVASPAITWSIPTSRLNEAKKGLREFGSIEKFDTNETPVPDYSELLHKEKVIEDEAEKIADLPAISGLVSAQLRMTRGILERYRAAQNSTYLRLYFIESGEDVSQTEPIRKGGPISPVYIIPAAKDSNISPKELWDRTPLDTACIEPSEVEAVVIVSTKNFESVHRMLAEYTRRRPMPPSAVCSEAFRDTTPIIVNPDEEFQLRQFLFSHGEIRQWNRRDGSPLSGFMRGARKYELLRKDLDARGGRLTGASHIETLVAAEIARLEPAWTQAQQMGNWTFIRFSLQRASFP